MASKGEGSADFWGIADNQAIPELGMGSLSPKAQSSDSCKTACTPLEKILSEAVQLLAGPGTQEDYTAALLAGLQARDIQHAWQLKYLTETDWEKIQIPGGSVSVRCAATNRDVQTVSVCRSACGAAYHMPWRPKNWTWDMQRPNSRTVRWRARWGPLSAQIPG